MAHRTEGLVISAVAGADLSASQYRAVVPHTTAGQVVAAGAATQTFLGILQDDPPAGQTGEVMVNGDSEAEAGAAFALNALLTTDAVGRLVTATTGQHVWALARHAAATAAGQYVTVAIGYRGTAP